MFKKLLAAVLALFAAAAFAAVDVNKADAAALDGVKGIGPAISAKIVDERKKGAFKDWNDLITRVNGIGEGSAAKLSEAGLTVNGASYKGAAPAAKKDDKATAKKDEKAAAAPKDDKKDAKAAAAPKDEKKDAKADKKAAEEKAKADKAEKKAAADKEKAEKKAAAEKEKAEKKAAADKAKAEKKDDKKDAKAAEKAASGAKK